MVYGVLWTGSDEVLKVARILRTEWYMEAVMNPIPK